VPPGLAESELAIRRDEVGRVSPALLRALVRRSTKNAHRNGIIEMIPSMGGLQIQETLDTLANKVDESAVAAQTMTSAGRTPEMRISRRLGFTVVELLVVIAIMGIIISLLFPAVQSAREAARRTRCNGNLRQIGQALSHHNEAHGCFPTGGWGHAWVGIPDRGIGLKQPGGWIYNILPFIEQAGLHDLGEGLDEAGRKATSAQRLRTPLPLFTCPSRRRCDIWPTVSLMPHLQNPRETDTVMAVARSDYAINTGDRQMQYLEGPSTLQAGDDPDFSWPDMSACTGVCYLRSRVRMADIHDGASNTYLVGEKYLNPDDYESGRDPGDNESMYNGYCADLHRLATTKWTPQEDKRGVADPYRFGSAHPSGCGFVLCDGYVKTVHYSIDPQTHACLGNRRDGMAVAGGFQ
jgi:prepilin-type N-terminal cleavage/methylation domain-containing protein